MLPPFYVIPAQRQLAGDEGALSAGGLDLEPAADLLGAFYHT